MLALAYAIVALATVCHAQLVTLSTSDKQAVLDAHNRLRAQVAMGNTGSQPTSSNLIALEWDDRLMDSAGTWVQQCIAGHDTSADRALPGYSWVGQNWAAGYSGNFSYYVQLWFDEYKDYTYSTQSCSAVCGHYTQVVWAKTAYIGCAVSQCSNYPYSMVCNYATGGNYNGELPYESGAIASKCGGDYSFVQRGLCVRKDACSGSDCSCSLASCTNGGTLDVDNCKCSCPTGFYGNTCEKVCEDEAAVKSLCDYYGTGICSYTSYIQRCAKTCSMCKATPVSDPAVVNADGVKGRSPA